MRGAQDLVLAMAHVFEMHDWRVVVPAALVLIVTATYLLTVLSYTYTKFFGRDGREPPIVPYWLPVLGSTIPFVRKTKDFIETTQRKWGDNTPYTVRLVGLKGYLIMQPEHFGPLLKATRILSNKKVMGGVMRDAFGTPSHVMPMYLDDDSGVEPKPAPGTSVPSHQRVWHYQHATGVKFLTGGKLRSLAARFTEVLSEAISAPDPNDPADSGGWVTIEDFYPWWRARVYAAASTALFGPHLLRLNPTLEDDFWRFAEAMPALAKRYPAWIAPREFAARRKMLDNLKRWHAHAREHSDFRFNGDGAPEWDEYWGSAWLKARQNWGQDTGLMDDDALASEDLALATAANANAIPSAFWYLLEIYRDPALLSRVLPELESAVKVPASPKTGTPASFDLAPVLTSPLLQSIYAEVLRMRVSVLLNRCADHADYRIGPWTLKKGVYVTLPSAHISYHETAWQAHTNGGKAPIKEFWAERFLVPDEGDTCATAGTEGKTTGAAVVPEEKAPKVRFSTQHVEGIWVPYGGGALMCPGRHFAKQEMMGSVAVFAHYYELEVISGKTPPMDEASYGTGAQLPAGKTPVRIRRKVGGWRAPGQS